MTDQTTRNDQRQDADRNGAIEHASDALKEKLLDAMTPGFEAECSPLEAEAAGAFREDALSAFDAMESVSDADSLDSSPPAPRAGNVVVGTFPTRNIAGRREA